jgi:ATP-dependent RNA helicase RhlE
MTFSNLGLNYHLLLLLNKQFYKSPYPIQSQAIPIVLEGKDLIGIAPTGSGKTVAYALPIIQKLIGKAEPKNRHPKVLVLVPTRELAVQVEKVFKSFCLLLPEKIKSMAVFGGVSINPQMMHLNGVQILVATPGRLLDLVESKALHLSALEVLVLDEADKMLNLGFAIRNAIHLKIITFKKTKLIVFCYL